MGKHGAAAVGAGAAPCGSGAQPAARQRPTSRGNVTTAESGTTLQTTRVEPARVVFLPTTPLRNSAASFPAALALAEDTCQRDLRYTEATRQRNRGVAAAGQQGGPAPTAAGPAIAGTSAAPPAGHRDCRTISSTSPAVLCRGQGVNRALAAGNRCLGSQAGSGGESSARQQRNRVNADGGSGIGVNGSGVRRSRLWQHRRVSASGRRRSWPPGRGSGAGVRPPTTRLDRARQAANSGAWPASMPPAATAGRDIRWRPSSDSAHPSCA